MTQNLPLSLYVHYPFCIRKCPYCDFNSYRRGTVALSDEAYTDALIMELKKDLPLALGRSFKSVYIGGGTPSLLSPALLDKVLKTVQDFICDDTEISMEANPGTVNLNLLKDFKSLGINRISLGVQSFNDLTLKKLGRIYDGNCAKSACEDIVKAGFNNFNVDIMHGIEAQSLKMAMEDLEYASTCGANHLSWYELTIEEDTCFGAHPPKLPSEDELCDIEEQGFAFLQKAGFKRYEVSGYTKDKKCQHNLNYWYFGDYLGIGAGAHSKITKDNGIFRRANAQEPLDYIKDLSSSGDLFYAVQKEELPFEFMLNRLRVFDFIKTEEFHNTTGLDFKIVEQKLLEAKSKGLIEFDKDGYFLTPLGKRMLNDILEMFL